jgi:hypothetical protein
MIRSLIVQLSTQPLSSQSLNISRALKSLFASKNNGQQRPTAGELLTTLQQMIEEFDETFVILDALDECNHRNELLEDIEKIKGWKKEKLHILVTSRKEPDIEEHLTPLVCDKGIICIQSALVDNDIRLYVRARLQNDSRLKRWHKMPEIQLEIERTLMEKANGM